MAIGIAFLVFLAGATAQVLRLRALPRRDAVEVTARKYDGDV